MCIMNQMDNPGLWLWPGWIEKGLDLNQISIRVAGEKVVDMVGWIEGGRLFDRNAVGEQTLMPGVHLPRNQGDDDAVGRGRRSMLTDAEEGVPAHPIDATASLVQNQRQAKNIFVEAGRQRQVIRVKERDLLVERGRLSRSVRGHRFRPIP